MHEMRRSPLAAADAFAVPHHPESCLHRKRAVRCPCV